MGVIIAAGGKGRRLGGAVPKQFRLLGGMTVIERTLRLFESHPGVHEIIVAAPLPHLKKVVRIVARSKSGKVSCVVTGGSERQHSVWKGLNAFDLPPDVVLVHDAVRPFVRAGTVTRVIRAAFRHKAAIVATRVKDTITVEGPRGYLSKSLERNKLWAVQTPQGFHFGVLWQAHIKGMKAEYLATDEASLVAKFMKIPARIVKGEDWNPKITTRDDLEMANLIVRMGKTGPRRARGVS